MERTLKKWNFFTDAEVQGLDQELCAMLDKARGLATLALREAWGTSSIEVPFRLTSTTGGAHCGHSAHYDGLAVDIGLGHLEEGFERDRQRWAIMHGLHAAGFRRIEDCPLHIHADRAGPPHYPSPVQWLGKDA